MYVCMYVFMNVLWYECVDTRMYACLMLIYVYMNKYMCLCVYVGIRVSAGLDLGIYVICFAFYNVM